MSITLVLSNYYYNLITYLSLPKGSAQGLVQALSYPLTPMSKTQPSNLKTVDIVTPPLEPTKPSRVPNLRSYFN